LIVPKSNNPPIEDVEADSILLLPAAMLNASGGMDMQNGLRV
jgi:hypothetical protein